MTHGSKRLLAGLTIVLVVGVAALAWLNLRGEVDASDASPDLDDAALAERGAYLARAGLCQGCHTPRGAPPYSGGRAIATPFGTVYSANLTPEARTGLGAWRAADFRRALHNGRSRDGRLLVPACPYDFTTRVSDADADALYVYLRRLPAVAQPRPTHELRFPYDTQVALALWRALFFRPGRHVPEPAQSAAWNRGAYLVRGLGHCGACHAARNALGASTDADALRGGLMAAQNWYAPALGRPAGRSEPEPLARLLGTGRSDSAVLLGPMAEVVLHGTQHLRPDDLLAMATYLHSLPSAPDIGHGNMPADRLRQRGERVYADHCAECHGDAGQGRQGAYVALAGNRAVLDEPPANLVHVVLEGAFAASTRANPRPFGMPPFARRLTDDEVAAVLTYIRSAWGHRATPVSPLQVERYRSSASP